MGFFVFFLNDKSKNIYPYQATRAVNCFLYNICSTSFAFDMFFSQESIVYDLQNTLKRNDFKIAMSVNVVFLY